MVDVKTMGAAISEISEVLNKHGLTKDDIMLIAKNTNGDEIEPNWRFCCWSSSTTSESEAKEAEPEGCGICIEF